MYRLRPYFDSEAVKVVPKETLYHLPSYHLLQATLAQNGDWSVEPTSSGVEQKNSMSSPCTIPLLAQRLAALEKRLDKYIASEGTKLKKDKQGERNRIDTKNRPKESGPLRQAEIPKSNSHKKLASHSTQLAPIPCSDLRSAPGSAQLRKELIEVGDLELTIRSSSTFDKAWLELLSTVGRARGVEIFPSQQNPNTKVENVVRMSVREGRHEEEVQLNCHSKSRVWHGMHDTWNQLGLLLGMCSTSTGADDRWLMRAQVYDEKREKLDQLTRQLGAYLGANDFLSEPKGVCLADLILRAFYHDEKSGLVTPWREMKVPNNVQLWAKRVDDVLATPRSLHSGL